MSGKYDKFLDEYREDDSFSGLASDVATDTTNFDGFFGVTEDTVQKALDVIDDHTHAGADLTGFTQYYVPFGNATGGLTEHSDLTFTADGVVSERGIKAGKFGILYAFTVGTSGLGFTAEGSCKINVGDLFLTDGSSKLYFGNAGGITPYWYIGHNGANMHIYANHVDANTIHIGKLMETNIEIDIDSRSITTPGDIKIDSDSAKLYLGDDQDLEVYHNGSNGYIVNNVGNLNLTNNVTARKGLTCNEDYGANNFAVRKQTAGSAAYYQANANIWYWNGSHIFNNEAANSNFAIQKDAAGNFAYAYDAGTDTNTFSGTFTIADFGTAGFIKNNASGVLSGGNAISSSDITDIATTYLKLDCTNDPITDALHFTSDTEYIDQEEW